MDELRDGMNGHQQAFSCAAKSNINSSSKAWISKKEVKSKNISGWIFFALSRLFHFFGCSFHWGWLYPSIHLVRFPSKCGHAAAEHIWLLKVRRLFSFYSMPYFQIHFSSRKDGKEKERQKLWMNYPKGSSIFWHPPPDAFHGWAALFTVKQANMADENELVLLAKALPSLLPFPLFGPFGCLTFALVWSQSIRSVSLFHSF